MRKTQSETLGRIVVWITIISGILALSVIVGVVVLAFIGRTVPSMLADWGGIILGFYFGQFVNLVRVFTDRDESDADANR